MGATGVAAEMEHTEATAAPLPVSQDLFKGRFFQLC